MREHDARPAAEGLIEGRNAVTEALRAGTAIDKLYIAKGETDRTLARRVDHPSGHRHRAFGLISFLAEQHDGSIFHLITDIGRAEKLLQYVFQRHVGGLDRNLARHVDALVVDEQVGRLPFDLVEHLLQRRIGRMERHRDGLGPGASGAKAAQQGQ